MRVGFICSSGGAVFDAAFRILKSCRYDMEIAVVTDRACGAEFNCKKLDVPFLRIEETERNIFCEKAAYWLSKEQSVDWVALFFTRLVSEVLYSQFPCVNFHPSLLPAFPGFRALENLKKSGARFFGATAHLVDHSTDGGVILAQAIAPVPLRASAEILARISFAQKLYLLLVLFEKAYESKLSFFYQGLDNYEGLIHSFYANPRLTNEDLEQAFLNFMKVEEIPWPILH